MGSKSQATKKCLICKRSSEKILCVRCRKNPFTVEDARLEASKKKLNTIFKILYSGDFAKIKNKNNEKFWDKHFTKELSLKDQDKMTKEKIKILISLIPKKKVKLLDVGFGQGYFEEEIINQNLKVEITGIDISLSAVMRARKKFKGTYFYGNLLNTRKKFKKNSFDVISAIEVIEHISPENIFDFFDSLKTLLKPDGVILISIPINEGLRNKTKNPSGHVRDYRFEILAKELELSGFTVSKKKVLYAFEDNYHLKSFLAKFLINRWQPNNLTLKAVKSS